MKTDNRNALQLRNHLASLRDDGETDFETIVASAIAGLDDIIAGHQPRVAVGDVIIPDPVRGAWRRIMIATTRLTGLDADTVCGKDRSRHVAKARHVAITALRVTVPDATYEQIGALFGRDQSSIGEVIRLSRGRYLSDVAVTAELAEAIQ